MRLDLHVMLGVTIADTFMVLLVEQIGAILKVAIDWVTDAWARPAIPDTLALHLD